MIRGQTKTINVMLQNGGVGDHIASLTAIDYILRRYDWITPLIWVPDMMKELAINLLPDHTQIFSKSEMRGRYQPSRITKSTLWDGHTSPMKMHPVDYAFAKLCDEAPPIFEKNYLRLKRDKIQLNDDGPENYVVVTTGYTSDVKEFRADYIRKIVEFVKSKSLEVVFIGHSNVKTGGHDFISAKFDEKILKMGINLVNKTTLIEAAAIMHDARAVVGVDNGLIHLAACTDIPIVCGYTFVAPHGKMPIRHNEIGWNVFPIVPDESLSCRFCQSDSNFLYGHDYRNCWYKGKIGLGNRVNLCTKQITPDKFIEKLEQVLCPVSPRES